MYVNLFIIFHHLPAGFFELIHQFAVREAIVSGRGIDFYIPKFSEIPFLFSAVAESVHARVKQCLLGGALF